MFMKNMRWGRVFNSAVSFMLVFTLIMPASAYAQFFADEKDTLAPYYISKILKDFDNRLNTALFRERAISFTSAWIEKYAKVLSRKMAARVDELVKQGVVISLEDGKRELVLQIKDWARTQGAEAARIDMLVKAIDSEFGFLRTEETMAAAINTIGEGIDTGEPFTDEIISIAEPEIAYASPSGKTHDIPGLDKALELLNKKLFTGLAIVTEAIATHPEIATRQPTVEVREVTEEEERKDLHGYATVLSFPAGEKIVITHVSGTVQFQPHKEVMSAINGGDWNASSVEWKTEWRSIYSTQGYPSEGDGLPRLLMYNHYYNDLQVTAALPSSVSATVEGFKGLRKAAESFEKASPAGIFKKHDRREFVAFAGRIGAAAAAIAVGPLATIIEGCAGSTETRQETPLYPAKPPAFVRPENPLVRAENDVRVLEFTETESGYIFHIQEKAGSQLSFAYVIDKVSGVRYLYFDHPSALYPDGTEVDYRFGPNGHLIPVVKKWGSDAYRRAIDELIGLLEVEYAAFERGDQQILNNAAGTLRSGQFSRIEDSQMSPAGMTLEEHMLWTSQYAIPEYQVIAFSALVQRAKDPQLRAAYIEQLKELTESPYTPTKIAAHEALLLVSRINSILSHKDKDRKEAAIHRKALTELAKGKDSPESQAMAYAALFSNTYPSDAARKRYGKTLQKLTQSPSPEVRIRAHAALIGAEDVEVGARKNHFGPLVEFLKSPYPVIRALALDGLMRSAETDRERMVYLALLENMAAETTSAQVAVIVRSALWLAESRIEAYRLDTFIDIPEQQSNALLTIEDFPEMKMALRGFFSKGAFPRQPSMRYVQQRHKWGMEEIARGLINGLLDHLSYKRTLSPNDAGRLLMPWIERQPTSPIDEWIWFYKLDVEEKMKMLGDYEPRESAIAVAIAVNDIFCRYYDQSVAEALVEQRLAERGRSPDDQASPSGTTPQEVIDEFMRLSAAPNTAAIESLAQQLWAMDEKGIRERAPAATIMDQVLEILKSHNLSYYEAEALYARYMDIVKEHGHTATDVMRMVDDSRINTRSALQAATELARDGNKGLIQVTITTEDQGMRQAAETALRDLAILGQYAIPEIAIGAAIQSIRDAKPREGTILTNAFEDSGYKYARSVFGLNFEHTILTELSEFDANAKERNLPVKVILAVETPVGELTPEAFHTAIPKALDAAIWTGAGRLSARNILVLQERYEELFPDETAVICAINMLYREVYHQELALPKQLRELVDQGAVTLTARSAAQASPSGTDADSVEEELRSILTQMYSDGLMCARGYGRLWGAERRSAHLDLAKTARLALETLAAIGSLSHEDVDRLLSNFIKGWKGNEWERIEYADKVALSKKIDEIRDIEYGPEAVVEAAVRFYRQHPGGLAPALVQASPSGSPESVQTQREATLSNCARRIWPLVGVRYTLKEVDAALGETIGTIYYYGSTLLQLEHFLTYNKIRTDMLEPGYPEPDLLARILGERVPKTAPLKDLDLKATARLLLSLALKYPAVTDLIFVVNVPEDRAAIVSDAIMGEPVQQAQVVLGRLGYLTIDTSEYDDMTSPAGQTVAAAIEDVRIGAAEIATHLMLGIGEEAIDFSNLVIVMPRAWADNSLKGQGLAAQSADGSVPSALLEQPCQKMVQNLRKTYPNEQNIVGVSTQAELRETVERLSKDHKVIVLDDGSLTAGLEQAQFSTRAQENSCIVRADLSQQLEKGQIRFLNLHAMALTGVGIIYNKRDLFAMAYGLFTGADVPKDVLSNFDKRSLFIIQGMPRVIRVNIDDIEDQRLLGKLYAVAA